MLSLYGSTEAEALRNYKSALAAAQGSDEDWIQSEPGRLPWWGRQTDRFLDAPRMTAWIDGSGRPNREARPRLEAQEFVEAACAEIGMGLPELVERSRRRDLTTLRFLVVGLGIERWGQRAGELGEVFGRRADYVSWWAKKARELRLTNPEWARRYDSIDEKLRSRFEERS